MNPLAIQSSQTRCNSDLITFAGTDDECQKPHLLGANTEKDSSQEDTRRTNLEDIQCSWLPRQQSSSRHHSCSRWLNRRCRSSLHHIVCKRMKLTLVHLDMIQGCKLLG